MPTTTLFLFFFANFNPRVAIFSLKPLGRILASNALRTADVIMGECHKTQVMIIFATDEENFDQFKNGGSFFKKT